MVDFLDSCKKKKIQTTDIQVKKLKKFTITEIYGTGDKQLASILKKTLGCGGAVMNDKIRLQGDQKTRCIQLLRQLDYMDI